MNRKIQNSLSSAFTNRMSSNFATSHFVQRFSHAAAARARLPLPPLGSVGDPYLIDRLRAPLTRFRD
jgi:hypothetical protein